MNTARRALLKAGPALAAMALAGCASPPTNYYRLAVTKGFVRPGIGLKIGVRSVSIPGYLSQNGIAKSGGEYQYNVYPNDLWAEALDDMLQDVLVQDLAQRLPASTVLGSGGSIGVSSDLLIETNILRFDPDSDGRIVMNIQVAIRSGRDNSLWLTHTYNNIAMPAGPDVISVVAAMSVLWGSAADQIANFVAESWSEHGNDQNAG